MIHTKLGLSRLTGFLKVCYIPSAPLNDIIQMSSGPLSETIEPAVTCARDQTPLVTSTSLQRLCEIGLQQPQPPPVAAALSPGFYKPAVAVAP